jgi:ABC-type transport system involved in multi-copper enzyme maturation permease subunit
MIWVTWRQHRTQAIACATIFCLLAIVAITAGIWMRSTFTSDGLAACLARSRGADCQGTIASFINKFSGGVTAVTALPLLAIPAFLGAIVGPLLLGRELEQGTWRLAWSQTVPRTKWLVTKLVLVTGGLVVFGAAVSLLAGWLLGPLDQVSGSLHVPFGFYGHGVVFTCSLLCSFGLGVLAGLLLRNTIGAMVVTYVAWDLCNVPVLLLSTGSLHIPAPATTRLPCPNGCPGASTGSVFPVTGHLGDQVLSLTRSGGELIVSYVPASRFWPAQFIAGGWDLAVAATAIAAAIWLLNRRTT